MKKFHVAFEIGDDRDGYDVKALTLEDVFYKLRKNFYRINVDGNPELNLDDVTLLTIREVA